ncbi:MAG: hypothetical protein IJH48_05490 [Oscillospiraceae bacterium]|nr:hypothetical protein [Oscillospiraceae bacterium]
MSFGFDRKKLSGATLSLYFLEFSAALPTLYVLVAVGYPGLLTTKGLFSFLFRLGASLVPRVWLWGLAWLYKLTARELLVCFALLIPALLIAVAADGQLRAKRETARRARIVFAALLTLEIVLHLLPLRLNTAFGTSANVIAVVVLVLCLALTLLDLRAGKNGE